MKNKASIWFYILTVLGYAAGIILCASLVFIPIGIYLIAGAITYYKLARLGDNELYYYSKILKGWAIFFSIVLFPIGLISIIPFKLITSNNIKVTSSAENQSSNHQATEVNKPESNQEKEPEQVVVSEEAMAKFLELKKFHDDGLITDAEFERARDSIFKN